MEQYNFSGIFTSHSFTLVFVKIFPIVPTQEHFDENESPLFRQLRDPSLLKGKCGVCGYKAVCGGCRARAYETTGDYLEAEPYCVYEPPAKKGN